jgi:hypothetical protein
VLGTHENGVIFGRLGTSTGVSVETASTRGTASALDFSVYPNPAASRVWVDIDLDCLDNGMYVVRITSGSKSRTRPIMKVRTPYCDENRVGNIPL